MSGIIEPNVYFVYMYCGVSYPQKGEPNKCRKLHSYNNELTNLLSKDNQVSTVATWGYICEPVIVHKHGHAATGRCSSAVAEGGTAT